MFKKCKGSVSILLVLILLPMFYLVGIVIDASKVVASENVVSGAGDLALNSILANYNRELMDVYGLFGVSESSELIEDVSNSFTESVLTSQNATGIIEIEVESFEVEFVPESSLDNPDVLKNQILEYMKIRAPVSVTQDMLMKFSFISDLVAQSAAISEGLNSANLLPEDKAAYETIFYHLFSQALTELFGYVDSNGEEPSEGSDNSYNEFEGIDSTSFDKVSDFFAVESVAIEQLFESILITEYITEMFSCATSGIGGEFKTLSGYPMNSDVCPMFNSEVEYILWGFDNESQNVLATKVLLLGVRFVMNSIYAFSSPEIDNRTFVAATAVAGWTGIGIPIVQNTLKAVLAVVESFVDVHLLMTGVAVPIYKDETTWRVGLGNSIDNVFNISTDVAPIDQSLTMTYKEYLKLFICIFSLNENKMDEMMTRVAEVIQLNLSSGADLDVAGKTVEKDQAFKLEECYTLVEVNSSVSVDTIVLGKITGFIESQGTSVSIDYYGMLGY